MTMALKHQHPPISESDLIRFEDYFHCVLPKFYKAFLQTSNGGTPRDENCVHRSEIDFAGENEFEVSVFYPLFSSPERPESVASVTEAYVEDLPPDGLAIGNDDFGNIIGIHCSNAIVFWMCTDPAMDLDYRIAVDLDISFPDFLNRLEKNDD